MSDRPWSGEPAKATPVGADRILILDSEDSNANKLVTITSIPGDEFFGPWTGTHNAGGQTFDDVGVIISNSANPATERFIRMANTDRIAWRNFANNDELSIFVDENDRMLFVGGQGIDMARDEIVNFAFLEPDVLNPADAGVLRLGLNQQISWRNAANTNNNTIGYPNDGFVVSMNGTPEYTFGTVNAIFANNNILDLGILNFDVTGTTAIAPSEPQILYDMASIPDQLLLNAPNATEIALYFNGGEEFTYNQTIADFHDNGLVNLGRTNFNQGTITYNATQVFDFDDTSQYRQITLTGDLTTLSTSNRAAGKVMTIVVVGDTVDRNLTFNTDWHTNPSDPLVIVPANSIVMISFYSTGTLEADVVVSLSEFTS